MRPVLAALLLAAGSSSSLAHPGRTDSSGGHHDRKNGGYHFHGGGASAPTVATAPRTTARTEAPSSARSTARTLPDHTDEAVFVTKSGKKYHRKGCRYTTNASEVSLADAIRKYTACSVCDPPRRNRSGESPRVPATDREAEAKAAKSKKDLMSDPGSREKAAATELSLAKALLANGKERAAKERLRALIEKFPGTAAANTAGNLLP